jgi:hypothetical protein
MYLRIPWELAKDPLSTLEPLWPSAGSACQRDSSGMELSLGLGIFVTVKATKICQWFGFVNVRSEFREVASNV